MKQVTKIASVIIVTKNQKNLLEKSLPILLKQNFKGKYEIIVVDSGSIDGAREYVQKFSVKLIEIPSENFVFARAFNIGAKKAEGEILIRLSGDVIPKDNNFLQKMVDPFKDKTVGGVYGKYIQTGKKGYSHPNFWPPERFPKTVTKYNINPNLFNIIFNMGELTSFAGGCCAIRKSMWLERPFNEKIVGGEDADYSLYIHLKGYGVVYNPFAEVIHEHKIEHLNAGFWPEIHWRIVFIIQTFKLLLIGN